MEDLRESTPSIFEEEAGKRERDDRRKSRKI